MGFIGVIAFDVHDDKVSIVVAREYHSPSGSVACLAFEHCEISPEEMIHECTLACVLCTDDGDCEVILTTVSK